MPHVEVDYILRVGALDGDGKGFKGMEGEGDEAAHGVVHRPSQQAGLDLKLQQAGVTCVKSGGCEKREAALNSCSPVGAALMEVHL